MADCQIFDAGNVVLQLGLTYRNARLPTRPMAR